MIATNDFYRLADPSVIVAAGRRKDRVAPSARALAEPD
jgi:hypothetical protein